MTTGREPKCGRLRLMLRDGALHRAIGCSDAVCAKLAADAGFDALWASGLAISASHGLPDASILTMSEFLGAARIIDRAVEIPVIADCDTGFGGIDNVAHMVREYEQAGIAGICIEDKIFPKSNSFSGPQRLASIEEFSRRIETAVAARSGPGGLVVIARVEAFIAGTGLGDALRRARAYQEAGADAILIHSKAAKPDEVLQFSAEWSRQGGRLPLVAVPTTYAGVTGETLRASGFSCVIYANQPLRASVTAMRRTLESLARHDSTAPEEADIAEVRDLLSMISMDHLPSRSGGGIRSRHYGGEQFTLLNPGPVNVHASVRDALNGSDICHREPEFMDLLSITRKRLVQLCGGTQEHAAVLLTGSGTAALESTLVSVVPAEGKILILDNGTYGERMFRIAAAHGLPHHRLQVDWGTPFDLDAVRRVLASDPSFTTVAMAHHETSTSMLNPLAGLGAMTTEFGLELVVDAIASVGGEVFDMIADGVDWCIGSSNKCIEGLPGLSFVCGRHDAFRALAEIESRGFYLDLGLHYEAQYVRGAPAFTPAVQTLYAFDQALHLLLEVETVEGRIERYGRLARTMRHGLESLGLEYFLEPEVSSRVAAIVRLPAGVSYRVLHDALKARGFVIYSASEVLGEVFRIATIGQITAADVDAFLKTIAELLSRLGGAAEAPVARRMTGAVGRG